MDITGTDWYAKSMSFFCFLWIPLFYLFWRSITGTNAASGGVLALLAGSIVALLQFFLGAMVEPGGFGLSRWLSGCIDIVVLPAIAPLLIYLVLFSLKITTGTTDFANFALLWLIPGGAIRALTWSSQHDPILLVLVPVLWTSIAIGAPFFITIIQNSRVFAIIPASLAILIVLFAAASSYWAFYSQKTFVGVLFLIAAVIPMFVSVILTLIKSGDTA